jgi:hypothetical protein
MQELSSLSRTNNSILSMRDFQQLQALEIKNKQPTLLVHASRKKPSFELKMENLFGFINSYSDNVVIRCFTVGFLYLPSGVILYNLRKLKQYLSTAKSAIKLNFIRCGFTEYLTQTETKFLLTENFTIIGNFSSEIKQWSIRAKKSASGNLQPGTSVLDFQNQNIRKLNQQLDHIDNPLSTLHDSNIIRDELKCEKCQMLMIQQAKQSSYLGYHWRCLSCGHT